MMPSLPSVQKDPGIVEDLRAMLAYYRALGIESLDVELPKTEMPLDNLRSEIGECARCKLSKHRKSLVFGEGNPEARLMFIGEAPGREEDLQGRPFVGEAGVLLTKLIEKMGLKREDVYIANIIKCRPPMNRDPEEDEVAPSGVSPFRLSWKTRD
jgi:hypothetical protein